MSDSGVGIPADTMPTPGVPVAAATPTPGVGTAGANSGGHGKQSTGYKTGTPAAQQFVRHVNALKDSIERAREENPSECLSEGTNGSSGTATRLPSAHPVRIQCQRLFEFFRKHCQATTLSLDIMPGHLEEARKARQVLLEGAPTTKLG